MLASSCIVEILRIYAPTPPYNPAQLEASAHIRGDVRPSTEGSKRVLLPFCPACVPLVCSARWRP